MAAAMAAVMAVAMAAVMAVVMAAVMAAIGSGPNIAGHPVGLSWMRLRIEPARVHLDYLDCSSPMRAAD